MSGPEKLSIGALISSLKPGQLWTVLGAIAGVIGGAFYLGGLVEQTRSDTALLGKDQTIAAIQAELAAEKASHNEAKAAVGQAADMVNTERHHRAMVELKSEFLNRYVSYALEPHEVSAKLFADYVCVLWRQTQDKRLQMGTGGIIVNPDQLGRGTSELLLALLQGEGIDPNAIRGLPPVGVSRDPRAVAQRTGEDAALADRAAATVSKVQITKTVKFFDGSEYSIPEPVALDVHLRDDCKPG